MEGLVDHHDWLVSNNLLTDQMKDNVAMCGYCLVENVMDVATSIDFNTKTVTYRLLLPNKLYDNLKLLERFNQGGSIGFFESLKLKSFIKAKRQNDETGMGYRLEEIGNLFIQDYLDKEWKASIELFKEKQNEDEDFWLHNEGDKPSD